MRVAILHNEVPPGASAADADVLEQLDAVSGWLRQLGHQPLPVPCTLDLDLAEAALRQARPDVVFNLVESLDGSDLRMHLAPARLARLVLPYTGVPAEAIFLTTHKLLAKARLARAGLPTPDWIGPGALPSRNRGAGTYIIKAVAEHASFGMNDDAVMTLPSRQAVEDEVRRRTERWGRPFFAEEYIDGREFNLSLLDGPQGPEVMPPAEIDFGSYPSEKPKIVGYEAKWAAGSFEYRHTPRRFDFPASDAPLLDRLRQLALDAWRLFYLSGYARVDFRVDAEGEPSILEVNVNCCLSPDAGFCAALARGGVAPEEAICRVLDAALARHAVAPRVT